MTALIILGCILLFFVLLFSLKATFCIAYNGETVMYVKVLFIKIKILPKKKKRGPHSMSRRKAAKLRKKLEKKADKKRKKSIEKKKKKQEKKEAASKQPKEKKSLSEISDIIKAITDIVKTVTKTFFGHLKIKVVRLHLNIATGDAATTAIAYGTISHAVFYLCELLEPIKGFSLPKNRDISISTDYLSDSSTADIKISFSIRVWHVLHVGIVALIKLIKHIVKIKAKKQK